MPRSGVSSCECRLDCRRSRVDGHTTAGAALPDRGTNLDGAATSACEGRSDGRVGTVKAAHGFPDAVALPWIR